MSGHSAAPLSDDLASFVSDLRRLANLVHVPVTGLEELRLERNRDMKQRLERVLGWPSSEYLPAKSTVSRVFRGGSAVRDWRNVGPIVALCVLKAKDRNIILDKIEHGEVSWWQERWRQVIDSVQPFSVIAPEQLPPDVSNFIGRRTDIALLDQILSDVRHDKGSVNVMAISAIGGTPGVGKTALAVHWSHHVKASFPDGQLHINLHGFDPLNAPMQPDEALGIFLRSLGISAENIPARLDERTVLYRSLLANRRILVVLDNAIEADQVRPLLPGSPRCMVVVTSRNRLSGLIAQDGAYPIRLDLLNRVESVELIRQLVGGPRVDAEPDAVAEMARQCGHLPLALRIAAEHVAIHPHMSLDSFVRELAQERRRLDVLVGDDRRIEVRAVFSWSYGSLPPDVARLFRLLGLHGGPEISLGLASAVAETSIQQVRQLLNMLISMHLLNEVSHERYRLHDLLREYATERAELDEPEAERYSASERMLSWYVITAIAARKVIAPHLNDLTIDGRLRAVEPVTFRSRNDALEWCELERINLVAAVRHAAEQGFLRIAVQLTLALGTFFNLRKHWPDWIATHQAALDAARQIQDPSAEGSILNSLGIAYREQRRFDEAIDCDLRALAIRRRIGDRRGEATTLINLGDKYEKLGRFEEAMVFNLQALSVAREVGSQISEAVSLTNLGEASYGLRRFEDALAYHNQALALHRELGDRQGEGAVLDNIGQALFGLKANSEAIRYLDQALAIRREVGDQHGECITLENLGNIWILDDFDCGRKYWTEALALAERLGDQYTADKIESSLMSRRTSSHSG